MYNTRALLPEETPVNQKLVQCTPWCVRQLNECLVIRCFIEEVCSTTWISTRNDVCNNQSSKLDCDIDPLVLRSMFKPKILKKHSNTDPQRKQKQKYRSCYLPSWWHPGNWFWLTCWHLWVILVFPLLLLPI